MIAASIPTIIRNRERVMLDLTFQPTDSSKIEEDVLLIEAFKRALKTISDISLSLDSPKIEECGLSVEAFKQTYVSQVALHGMRFELPNFENK